MTRERVRVGARVAVERTLLVKVEVAIAVEVGDGNPPAPPHAVSVMRRVTKKLIRMRFIFHYRDQQVT